ncbi:MAG TPA: asparagine synthase-related protein [Vicinamibacterales bacterium]|jgi:asparagine synthase (glutamine-hydrolysing)|nr:asparagine synthase-related protein [Vicinamibacterales bacterium]
MKFFTCLVDPESRGISLGARRAYEVPARAHGLHLVWHLASHMAILTASDDTADTVEIAKHGPWTAVGFVRLDNRDDVRRSLNGDQRGAMTDLHLLLRLVARSGARDIQRCIGDFAFVAWNDESRTVVAAVDAFAVRKLYYSERNGIVGFSSRAEGLALEERYDRRYLAQLLALHTPDPNLTVYAGIAPLPGGSTATYEQGSLTIRKYWDALAFERKPTWAGSEQEAIETCRSLLAESLRQRIGGAGETWATLSGGMDSSSIVSLTQWLFENGQIAHGLAGTVTFVDQPGTPSDERAYSDSVVQRWRIRNEAIVEAPTWFDDTGTNPLTDQPRVDLQFYPRERRMADIVRAHGGRVLLTGWGGDEVFVGSRLYFADWVVQGHIWRTIRELVRLATIGRVSFWELAYKTAIAPLLPTVLRPRGPDEVYPLQPWLNEVSFRQHGVAFETPGAAEYGGRPGWKYRHQVALKVAELAGASNRDTLSDFIEVRHPMLYRPLVEFALCLPAELRTRPHAHRWVLREALRGILPDKVRARVGKPDGNEVLASSMAVHRASLAQLLEQPILGDLGLINVDVLRSVFEGTNRRTPQGADLEGPLHSTLAVEAWLEMRSGRWPRGFTQQHEATDALSPALSMRATSGGTL